MYSMYALDRLLKNQSIARMLKQSLCNLLGRPITGIIKIQRYKWLGCIENDII